MTLVDRTMLRDRIKDIIIERILDGTYPPGERIVEMTLATELGTSQAPVREALRDLAAMRFIDSIPYRGSRVRMVTLDELAETYPVRAALEELAGNLAAVNAGEELIEQLQVELDAMREFARSGDVHQQLLHDVRFHELIFEAAHNRVLMESWRALRIEARTLVSVLTADVALLEVANTHVPILEALRRADPVAAGRELRTHIELFARGLAQAQPPH